MYSEQNMTIWRIGMIMGFGMLTGYIVTFCISVLYAG